MAKDTSAQALGTENIRWNLEALYAGPEDAAIAADMKHLQAMLAGFESSFKGQLATKLGAALTAYAELVRLMSKVRIYFFLSLARDTTDAVMRREDSKVQEVLAANMGRYLTFFELELARLDEAALQVQMADKVVAFHAPYIKQIRDRAAHYLEENVERALVLRSPYGPSEWNDMLDELDAALRFEVDGEMLNLSEALHITSQDKDAGRRARALKAVNEGLDGQKHTYFVARALNVLVGDRLADDDMRGFTHPMQATNLENMVDEATVDALHDAVSGKGAELARRFYKLKARLIGQKTLRWSDRNAQMPFAADNLYAWHEACAMVKKAYRDFSPTLGGLVDKVLDEANGWVDAPPAPIKTSGAFDYTTTLPHGVHSYMMLNYMGATNDVMTLAHELGHAVHGLLAAEAQGPLMWNAPIPYAETASIFGEMLTFESLLAQTHDKQAQLAMYMEKMTDFLNSVVRQINFSEFEKGMYAKRRDGKLSVAEFDALWMDTTKRFYGQDGEIFTYEDTDHLWSYVGHFPSYRFYVYGYAFGELFTQSLMATRGTVGAKFEPLYVDLLRAGGTKDAVALVAPFGLNPTHADFWEQGLEASFGQWLAKAEALVAELGL